VASRASFQVTVDGAWQTWRVLGARFHHGRLLVRFDALPDRTAVTAAQGTELFVSEEAARTALADPDFYYNSDLIGLEMIDGTSAEALGRVTDVIEMPAQNLLEVRRAQGEGTFLVPFTAAFVNAVSLEAGTVHVTLPEGLADL